ARERRLGEPGSRRPSNRPVIPSELPPPSGGWSSPSTRPASGPSSPSPPAGSPARGPGTPGSKDSTSGSLMNDVLLASKHQWHGSRDLGRAGLGHLAKRADQPCPWALKAWYRWLNALMLFSRKLQRLLCRLLGTSLLLARPDQCGYGLRGDRLKL